MKRASFYTDVDRAICSGIIGRVSARLNGRLIKRVIAAKSGRNGFVEYHPEPFKIKGDCFVSRKLRGNVKISISHELNGEKE